MNKRMKYYSAIWLVAFAVFNVCYWAFLPRESSYTAPYAVINAAFILQLISGLFALKEKNNRKLLYNLSLINVSYIGLVIILVVSVLFVFTGKYLPIPAWIYGVICAIAIGFTLISLIKTKAAIDEVERIEQKIKNETYYMKSLTVDAEGIIASSSSPEMKNLAKRVYEALRYSDPVSVPELSAAEKEISDLFKSFSTAVTDGNISDADIYSEKLLKSIEIRNQKCKLLK